MNAFKETVLETLATTENFEEDSYLSLNEDVAAAVSAGAVESGRQHFIFHGEREGRRMRTPPGRILPLKREKIGRIKHLVKSDVFCEELDGMLDCMTLELKKASGIVDTDAVSSNKYGAAVVKLIHGLKDGLILDCGAGRRPIYYSNVVTFDVVGYDTTDVCGVGESLPFKSNSFDAVISLAVLEHVKQPFECAREISRVLKPGGTLLCQVPFLSPVHGYPGHYYNMTAQGLRNLFEPALQVDYQWVPDAGRPIAALSWILNSWANGLAGAVKEEFLNMKVSDLMSPALTYRNEAFVQNLNRDTNFELACVTFIRASKPAEVEQNP